MLQGPELLAQELREAFLNAKLADHAGEPWARLDVAGCELKPGGGHADALREVRLWAILLGVVVWCGDVWVQYLEGERAS